MSGYEEPSIDFTTLQWPRVMLLDKEIVTLAFNSDMFDYTWHMLDSYFARLTYKDKTLANLTHMLDTLEPLDDYVDASSHWFIQLLQKSDQGHPDGESESESESESSAQKSESSARSLPPRVTLLRHIERQKLESQPSALRPFAATIALWIRIKRLGLKAEAFLHYIHSLARVPPPDSQHDYHFPALGDIFDEDNALRKVFIDKIFIDNYHIVGWPYTNSRLTGDQLIRIYNQPLPKSAVDDLLQGYRWLRGFEQGGFFATVEFWLAACPEILDTTPEHKMQRTITQAVMIDTTLTTQLQYSRRQDSTASPLYEDVSEIFDPQAQKELEESLTVEWKEIRSGEGEHHVQELPDDIVAKDAILAQAHETPARLKDLETSKVTMEATVAMLCVTVKELKTQSIRDKVFHSNHQDSMYPIRLEILGAMARLPSQRKTDVQKVKGDESLHVSRNAVAHSSNFKMDLTVVSSKGQQNYRSAFKIMYGIDQARAQYLYPDLLAQLMKSDLPYTIEENDQNLIHATLNTHGWLQLLLSEALDPQLYRRLKNRGRISNKQEIEASLVDSRPMLKALAIQESRTLAVQQVPPQPSNQFSDDLKVLKEEALGVIIDFVTTLRNYQWQYDAYPKDSSQPYQPPTAVLGYNPRRRLVMFCMAVEERVWGKTPGKTRLCPGGVEMGRYHDRDRTPPPNAEE